MKLRNIITALGLALGLIFPAALFTPAPVADAYISGCSTIYEDGGSWARSRCTTFNTLSPIQSEWMGKGKCWKSDGSTWYAVTTTGWHSVGTTRYSISCPWLSGIGQTYLLSGVYFIYRT